MNTRATGGRHVQHHPWSKKAARSFRIWLGVCAVFLLCFGCQRLADAASDDVATVRPGVTAAPLPSSEPAPPPPPPSPSPSPPPKPSPSPPRTTTPPPPPEPETDPRFDTCAEALDEGFGPYVQDVHPEYHWYEDRDDDGIVCEESDQDDEEQEPPAEEPPPDSGTDPRFDTCAEANDEGYGPYRLGVDPEYHWYEDRDDDGLVCERR